MSILTKIRNKTGLLLTLVAGGIGLFIVQDGLTSLMSAQGDTRTVGEISGESISPQEFDQLYKQTILQYEMNSGGKALSEPQRNAAREQAWNELIFQKAYAAEFEKLGIQVTEGKSGERFDMVQGNTIHDYLLQQFKDSLGQFDRTAVTKTLQSFGQDPNSQIRWELFEQAMVKDRLQKKYEGLISKSNYVTTAEAKKKYEAEASLASFDYLYVPYTQVADSLISTTDTELSTYLNANKKDFKTKEGKTIEYISFDVKPSEADIAEIQKQIQGLTEAFKTEQEAEAFANLRSDSPQQVRELTQNELPAAIKADSNISVGNVYGPFLEGNSYNSYKVTSFINDTTKAARASHILFKAEDKTKAEEILAEAKAGADFAELAKQYGTDGTKNKGGDLEEFTTGQMVAPFQEAVFSAKKLGVLPTLVESQFGFHIVKVTGLVKVKEIAKKYKVVTLNKELIASRQTRDNTYREASLFAKEVTTIDAFKTKAEEKGLKIEVAENVVSTAQNVKTLSSAREIVQWAYREAEQNQLSKVFELANEKYVIAVVTKTVTKDQLVLDAVKDDVKKAYLIDKKAEKLTSEVKVLSGTLAEKKQKLVDEKKYHGALQKTANGINLENPYISGVGEEATVVSQAFSLEKDKESDVIKGKNGIFIITLNDATFAQEVADYSSSKNKILQELKGSSGPRYGNVSLGGDSQKINEVIKDKANIKDLRYNVY